ncbi:MAG: hypothetical protein FJ271_30475 [Planctomycetes bacterium]|nr:hypothetical protein [Planctomycetota bacterium]
MPVLGRKIGKILEERAATQHTAFCRALIEAAWTPKQAGYYRLEVELKPSPDHTILEGFASKVIPVSTVDEP